MVTHLSRAEVHALLALRDEVPRELIDLRSSEYLEFTRFRAPPPVTLKAEVPASPGGRGKTLV